MKIVHMADLHLGFRQFDALAPNGVNQREIDVARTVSRAMDLVIAERPDLIVIGGDVFHQSRPSNPAIVHAFTLFTSLRRQLPDTEIIIVAGNHDAPRTADAGCILDLFKSLNIEVVENRVEHLVFSKLDTYVLAVPDVVGLQRPPLVPDPLVSAPYQHRVLLMHGEIAGVMRVQTAHEIEPMDLNAEAWSYIALGHYHVYRAVAPRAYYSGSLDYVSSDPWGEMREQAARGVPGKGFVVHDMASGEHRFVPVEVTREYVDLTPVDCADKSVEDINRELAYNVAITPIDERVVRQVLTNCPRSLLRELDQEAVRDYQARALHYRLDPRKPELSLATVSTSTEEGARRPLHDTLTGYLQAWPIPPEIDRAQFVALGASYLDATREEQPHTMELGVAA